MSPWRRRLLLGGWLVVQWFLVAVGTYCSLSFLCEALAPPDWVRPLRAPSALAAGFTAMVGLGLQFHPEYRLTRRPSPPKADQP